MAISYSSEKYIMNDKGIQREMYCSSDNNKSPICKEKVSILDASTSNCSLMELLNKNLPLSQYQSRKQSGKKSSPKKSSHKKSSPKKSSPKKSTRKSSRKSSKKSTRKSTSVINLKCPLKNL